MLGHTILAIFIILAILIVFSKPPENPEPTTVSLSVQDATYVEFEKMRVDPRIISREVSLVKENVPRPHTGVDIGSSTGERVHEMNKKGLSTTGLDSSKYMVRYAKQTFPDAYVHGEYTSPILFQEQSLSHVTCLNYTFCFIRDKASVFKAVHHWLEPGGLFFIHVPLQWKYGPSSKYSSSLVHNTLRETIELDKTYKMNRPVYWEKKEKVILLASSLGFEMVRVLPLYETEEVIVFKSVDLVYL